MGIPQRLLARPLARRSAPPFARPFARGGAVLAAAAIVAALGTALSLSGCAVPTVTSGEGREAVLARWGTPTARYRMPSGGERLEYASGPFGRSRFALRRRSTAGGASCRSRAAARGSRAAAPGRRWNPPAALPRPRRSGSRRAARRCGLRARRRSARRARAGHGRRPASPRPRCCAGGRCAAAPARRRTRTPGPGGHRVLPRPSQGSLPVRAGFAPTGRRTKFHEVIASFDSFRTA